MPPQAAPVRLYATNEEVHRTPAYFCDNRTRPSHWEHDLWVIQRTIEGQGFYEDAKGRHLVGPNQAMLFAHNDVSRYGYPPESRDPYRLRYLSFTAGFGLHDLFAQIRQDFGSVVSLPVGSVADQLFNELFVGFRAQTIPDQWHETELLFRLLLATYREQIAATTKGDPIARAHHFMCDRFRSCINLTDAADYCGLSREHLCRAFHKRYDVPPAVFLRNLRLRHAQTLLISTKLAVEDIAVGCGFTHANAFARSYRKAFGHSPTDTRKSELPRKLSPPPKPQPKPKPSPRPRQ